MTDEGLVSQRLYDEIVQSWEGELEINLKQQEKIGLLMGGLRERTATLHRLQQISKPLREFWLLYSDAKRGIYWNNSDRGKAPYSGSFYEWLRENVTESTFENAMIELEKTR